MNDISVAISAKTYFAISAHTTLVGQLTVLDGNQNLADDSASDTQLGARGSYGADRFPGPCCRVPQSTFLQNACQWAINREQVLFRPVS